MLLARCVMAVTILWSLAAPELVGTFETNDAFKVVPGTTGMEVVAVDKLADALEAL